MNSQTTYTLLSSRFSLIRNSIYSKVAVTTILSIVVASFLLALYLFYINLSETKKYEEKIVIGQIKHTLSLTESKRLTADFNFIAKSIKHISFVESVILFDKSCNAITQIPLNANNKTICKKRRNLKGWIYYEMNDPFSKLYAISVLVRSSALTQASKNILFIILIVVTFSILSGLLIIFYLRKYFKESFDNIITLIINLSPEEKDKDFDIELPLELLPIKESLLNTKKDLQNANIKIVEQARTQATAELCLQIAHDIRSPLPALEMISEESQRTDILSVGDKKILKMCVNRISDIANELLEKKSNLLDPPYPSVDKPVLLSTLIGPIITEKRISVNIFDNIEIDFQIQKNSLGTFVTLDIKRFQALLANLIQNSIEAIENKLKGAINIALSTNDTTLSLEIKDNGKGIKNEDIEKIKKKGISIDKEKGTGLGLFHAIEDINSFGGKLEISSELNVGTTINISLDKSIPPKWFCKNLRIDKNSTLVILDDDSSIHEIWEKKMSLLPFNVKLKHFRHVQNFKKWYNENKSELDYFLCDLELGQNSQSGFEIIKELNLSKKATLVTSWHQDEKLQEDAISLELKILPKELIPNISINQTTLRAVLIDDDEITRFNWEQSAKKNNLKILTYNSVEDFLEEAEDLCKNTTIYIDSSLGKGIKGEIVSEEIYKLGFKDIFLSTGHKKESIQKKKWIKDIVNKKPPWIREE